MYDARELIMAVKLSDFLKTGEIKEYRTDKGIVVVYCGDWAAGDFIPSQQVTHGGNLWQCINDTNIEPADGVPDWIKLG